MENIQSLIYGFHVALTVQNLIAAVFGGVMGLIVGAMPGLGSLTGVALLLPLTFKMEPTTGIIMLAAIYYANMYGGSFSAILLNIPGDSPAVMTALDGYPLSKNGKAGKALFAANISSFIGGTIGIIILTMVGPALAKVGLAFGPAEQAALILFALTSIGWLLGDAPLKGLLTTSFGLLLATIGVDLQLGSIRYTFGSINLLSGVTFIPLVIGMFGFSQVMDMMINRKNFNEIATTKLTIKESMLTFSELKGILPTIFRSGFLGNFVGLLPGAGATTGSFLSYILEKKVGRDRANLGTGSLSGVAAAESANNAAAAGAFAPLLALGIPGSGTAAVLLGGLMMWGLRPGPLLFKEAPDFVWGLIASMYVGNIIVVILALAIIPFVVNILRVPLSIMAPLVAVVCIVGSYSVNNSMFDVWFMIGSGVIAYLFNVYDYPVAPLLLAFVLAPRFEQSIRQAFEISNGSAIIFFKSPIALTFIILIVVFVLSPIIMKMFKKNGKEA
ncbi:MAG: tricarboxylate transporter [Clostridiaceae bacterium BRH_c20a]|nr:MAG: tricarboxylate transporter [Clostridiaceae bacterium BRH_c20a]